MEKWTLKGSSLVFWTVLCSSSEPNGAVPMSPDKLHRLGKKLQIYRENRLRLQPGFQLENWKFLITAAEQVVCIWSLILRDAECLWQLISSMTFESSGPLGNGNGCFVLVFSPLPAQQPVLQQNNRDSMGKSTKYFTAAKFSFIRRMSGCFFRKKWNEMKWEDWECVIGGSLMCEQVEGSY